MHTLAILARLTRPAVTTLEVQNVGFRVLGVWRDLKVRSVNAEAGARMQASHLSSAIVPYSQHPMQALCHHRALFTP